MRRQIRVATLAFAVIVTFSGLSHAQYHDDDDGYYQGDYGQARHYGYQQVSKMGTTEVGTKGVKTTRTIFGNQTGGRPAADISNGWDPWRRIRMPIVMVTGAASVQGTKA